MSAFHKIRPAIFLDYGLDAVDADDAACEICERGMRFKAQWQFTLGTMLHIAFALGDDESSRIQVEAMVIDCAATERKAYQTTLSFLEIPQELRESLGKVSTRLDLRQLGVKMEPTAP